MIDTGYVWISGGPKIKILFKKQKFGFGFERIIVALEEGALVDDRRRVNVE